MRHVVLGLVAIIFPLAIYFAKNGVIVSDMFRLEHDDKEDSIQSIDRPIVDKNTKHTIEDIKKLAATIFNDASKAEEWLNTPTKALGGCTPACKLNHAEGIEEVVKILNNIVTDELS